MKNSFLIIIFSFFFFVNGMTENLFIESKNITVDKDKEVSIFENDVKVITEDNKVIKSDYAEYNKKRLFNF